MIDRGEADDKIIGVLENDLFWGGCEEVDSIPDIFVERLTHYFSTYKMVPGEESVASVAKAYDRAHAVRVIEAAMEDYDHEYGS